MIRIQLTCLILLMALIGVQAQTSNACIETIRTNSRLFHGQIDHKYDITIYLQYANPSTEHSGFYSVSGWYYYDKFKQKIPLAGIYDGSLTLYATKNKSLKEKILNLQGDGDTFWDQMQSLGELTGYDEKLIISSKGSWSNGTKTLDMNIDDNDLAIVTATDYLKINSNQQTYHIRLNDLSIYESGFELIADELTGAEKRFLIRFESPSRPYVNGMCGAGTEAGYILLTFDSAFQLTAIQNEMIESCINTISYEKMPQTDRSVITYQITDYVTDKSKRLIVNTQMVDMKIVADEP